MPDPVYLMGQFTIFNELYHILDQNLNHVAEIRSATLNDATTAVTISIRREICKTVQIAISIRQK